MPYNKINCFSAWNLFPGPIQMIASGNSSLCIEDHLLGSAGNGSLNSTAWDTGADDPESGNKYPDKTKTPPVDLGAGFLST